MEEQLFLPKSQEDKLHHQSLNLFGCRLSHDVMLVAFLLERVLQDLSYNDD
jgi:hypothetical protein